uniref:ING domain-containing protein n=1 Tax=Haemonchus contortus TaxID=6289 RepID=A0A7I4YXH2_HAECO
MSLQPFLLKNVKQKLTRQLNALNGLLFEAQEFEEPWRFPTQAQELEMFLISKEIVVKNLMSQLEQRKNDISDYYAECNQSINDILEEEVKADIEQQFDEYWQGKRGEELLSRAEDFKRTRTPATTTTASTTTTTTASPRTTSIQFRRTSTANTRRRGPIIDAWQNSKDSRSYRRHWLNEEQDRHDPSSLPPYVPATHKRLLMVPRDGSDVAVVDISAIYRKTLVWSLESTHKRFSYRPQERQSVTFASWLA